MRRLLSIFLVLATGAGPAAPPGPAVPTVVSAEPASAWNAKFDGKKGWIGGDVAYSVAIGPRRVVWLFGDTFLGTAQDGQRHQAVMVNNTVAVQDGHGPDAAIRFVHGKDTSKAFITPVDGKDKSWFWPQDAVAMGGRLFIFLSQMERTKDTGVFNFKHLGTWLAVVENPEDDPAAWRVKQHQLPFVAPGEGRSWGSALLADGGRLYVFGWKKNGKGMGHRELTVARAPAEKLDDFAAWRFRTSDGWSEKAAEAAGLADGVGVEFTVSRRPGGKGFVLVSSENGLSGRILGRFSDAPEGPWSAPVLLYTCPEMGKDKGLFTYEGKFHLWASTENELLISYCVNAWDFARLMRDEAVYRPKFVRVKLGPAK